MMADKQPRDLRGRFSKIDVERDVLAPDLGIPQMFAYGTVRRHAPAGDDLAQGGESSPPGVRTARMIGGQLGTGDEIYAPARARTLRDDVTTGESGRPWAQQARYILGDVGESAPGEVAATQRFGIQGRHVREAARRSADPMDLSKYLSGAE
jgi:hypothetical protein